MFPDEGMVLIAAPSGSGKTSILKAILFALFGNGTKIVQHGKKKCSVELWFKELHIVRTKGPCRLVVNDVYEDDAGQHCINQYVINSLGYLEQNGRNNFVNLSPEEKISFLERIVFNNVDIQSMKQTIKERIKHTEDQLLVINTEIQNTQHHVSSLKPVKRVCLPKGTVFNETTVSEYTQYLSTLYDRKRDVERKQKEYTNHRERMNDLQKRYTEYLHKQKELEDRIVEDTQRTQEYTSLKTRSEELRTLLKTVEQYREYDTIVKTFNREKHVFDTNVRHELETQQQHLKDIIDNIQSLPIQTVDECKRMLDRIRETHRLRKELKVLEGELDTLYSQRPSTTSVHDLETEISNSRNRISELNTLILHLKTLYSCPSCHRSLKMDSNRLVLEENVSDIQETIEKYTMEIQSLKTDIQQKKHEVSEQQRYEHKKNHLETSIQRLKQTIDIKWLEEDTTTYETTLERLVGLETNRNMVSSQIGRLERTYNIQKKHLLDLKHKCKSLRSTLPPQVDTDEHSLRKEYQSVSKRMIENEVYISNIRQHQSRLEDVRNDIRSITQQISSMNTIDHHDYTTEITEIEKDIHQTKDRIMVLQQYDIYHTYITQKNTLNETLRCKTMERDTIQSRLVSEIRFKELVKDAETTTMSNLIQTINTNLEVYINMFFPDGDMQVYVDTQKRVKKSVKTSIHIVVSYKGQEVDISTLSGGERDRVVLAFTITLAELSCSPFVLLDECVSSLDQENATNVFESIKHVFSDKLIVFIAHQIVEGMFDQVIKLK